VRVRSPRADRLAELVRADGAEVAELGGGALHVSGATAEHIGALAAGSGIMLYELTPLEASLEEAFMNLTREAVEFHTAVEAVAS
jgi:ABC-2 type transport system ATP-binding protein